MMDMMSISKMEESFIAEPNAQKEKSHKSKENLESVGLIFSVELSF